MTKLNVMDAITDMETTCTKAKCMVNELGNKHFSTRDITENVNLLVYSFPSHQTIFEILEDYIAELERQICELQVGLSEGGIEI